MFTLLLYVYVYVPYFVWSGVLSNIGKFNYRRLILFSSNTFPSPSHPTPSPTLPQRDYRYILVPSFPKNNRTGRAKDTVQAYSTVKKTKTNQRTKMDIARTHTQARVGGEGGGGRR